MSQLTAEQFSERFYACLKEMSEHRGCIGCMRLLKHEDRTALYARYLMGEDVKDLAAETADWMDAFHTKAKEHGIVTLDQVKERLYVSLSKCTGSCTGVPCRRYGDMVLTCRVMLGKEQKEGSVLVTDELLDLYAFTPNELFRRAAKSAKKLFPVRFKDTGNVFTGDAKETGLILLTSDDSENGASALFYAGIMRAIGAVLQDGYTVLPSSVHEVLLLQDRKRPRDLDLDGLVREVNRDCVSEKEQLSTMAYHYDPEGSILEPLREYDRRHPA